MIRTVALFAAVCLAAPFVQTQAQAQSDKIFDKSYPANGRPDLQVVADDSSVRAQSCGGCREVRIHVDTRDMNLSDFRLQESQSGNLIRFSFKRPQGSHWNWGRHHSPEITVSLPTESSVSLHTSDGSISLAGTSGTADLHTGDGSVSVAETNGDLHVNTGDGSVTLQHVAGTLSATTGDGSIHGEGRFSQLDARAGDGSITLAALDGSTLSSGVHITTGDGSVQLRVPRSLHADVELRAGDGSVHCDLPLMVQSSSNDHHAVRGSLNGGGSIVRVSTGDGSIQVSGL